MRPLLGTWPTTQACALTGNQTSDYLVHRPVLNPLSHTSQGSLSFLKHNLAASPSPLSQQFNVWFCCLLARLVSKEKSDTLFIFVSLWIRWVPPTPLWLFSGVSLYLWFSVIWQWLGVFFFFFFNVYFSWCSLSFLALGLVCDISWLEWAGVLVEYYFPSSGQLGWQCGRVLRS